MIRSQYNLALTRLEAFQVSRQTGKTFDLPSIIAA